MEVGICPVCKRLVCLTKHGKFKRHGWRSYASNQRYNGFTIRDGFKMVETKSECPGSHKFEIICLKESV